jgi:hypothetical protein
MNKIWLIIPLFLSLCACQNKGHSQNTNEQDEGISQQMAADYLAINCYTCHDPRSPSHDAILAPPLAGVKGHYLEAYPEKEAFVEAMTTFILNPTAEDALMKGPVRRFGVMPKTTLTADQVKAIVNYIYEQDIPKPDWYDAHHQERHGNKGKGGGQSQKHRHGSGNHD